MVTLNEEKRPKCPNCGLPHIKERWVRRSQETEIKWINFDEYAEDMKQRETFQPFRFEGTYTPPQLSDFVQLVIECEKCGFTKVYDIEGKKEK